VDTAEFLQTVITCPTEGYFCLAVSNGSGGWLEQWYKWPSEIDKIVQRADAQKDHANCYFSLVPVSGAAINQGQRAAVPNHTSRPGRRRHSNPAPRADGAGRDLTQRHQGYWVLEGDGLPLPPDEHEELSKKLTYSISPCATGAGGRWAGRYVYPAP
jgi:hypothetical protein